MFEDLGSFPDLERKALRAIDAYRLAQRRATVRRHPRPPRHRRTVRRAGDAEAREPPRPRLEARPSRAGAPRALPLPLGTPGLRHMVTSHVSGSRRRRVCIMDTSGSMDTMQSTWRAASSSSSTSSSAPIPQRGGSSFIAHHTEANEVDREEFFHKGESGWTFISSLLQAL